MTKTKAMILRYLMTTTLLIIGSVCYSQYKYEIKLVSLNGLHPKEVLTDIAKHTEVYSKHYDDRVFFFESKVLYTEENFNEIAAATGYTIKEFKIMDKKENGLNIEE